MAREFNAETIKSTILTTTERTRYLVELIVLDPDSEKQRKFFALKKEWSKDGVDWFPKTSILLDYDTFQVFLKVIESEKQKIMEFLEE